MIQMKSLIATLYLSLCLLTAYGKSEPNTAVTLEEFNLIGELTNGEANFTLSATAHVENPRGGTIQILSGPVALTQLASHPKWTVRTEDNHLSITFDRRGSFPIRLQFAAAVRHTENGNSVSFRVAASPIQPVTFEGIAAETELVLAGAAPPERSGTQFRTHLPPDGMVNLSWKNARPEGEGKLFYAAEMLSQISLSPGLMRQLALLDFKVMQGELSTLSLLVHGTGEVTRVQGEQVLSWTLEPVHAGTDRRLVVRLNQPQKDLVKLQVQMQTPLGAFPQRLTPIQLRPEGATRFSGYLRVVNEGAVRLEIAQSAGLAQISPEQFPETEASRVAMTVTGNQRFAYRFSEPDYNLGVQADQVWPELGVSQLLAYRVAENELTIDAEIELEIREAPLRELLLRVPKGYAVARLNAAGLADYFVHESEDQADAELKLVFAQPVSDREVVELHLERNKALGENTWTLPHLEVVKAKSVRGHIAVAADAGFRLSPERTRALTEISTAFFPRKLTGIQTAFRLTDANWQATLHVERLPQLVQADVFHLFSVGEGIAYASSLINYAISGAPVSVFRVELSDEYFNVEFVGKDIRNWQKTDAGYIVQLHTPVSGPYTLLATYERPFKVQGEILGFSGARPSDAQSEQGHTLVISTYQFQVKPVEVSPGLLPLETGEVPPEYRLFFDAPILAAYRYAARPFNLRLSLSPLAQGDSLSQVVDRASLNTKISKEGEAVTAATYFVKNRGHPYFRLGLPADTQLWSATVNGAPVVPVIDAGANLIPLPPGKDPNAVLTVELKLAARSKNAHHLKLSAPLIDTPVMLAQWKLEPDTGQRLVYRGGSLTPTSGVTDGSGFAQLAGLFVGEQAGHAQVEAVILLVLLASGLLICAWASAPGVHRFSARHVAGLLVGTLAFLFAIVAFVQLVSLVQGQKISLPREFSFLVPVQQPGASLSLQMANVSDKLSFLDIAGLVWPGFLAIPISVYALVWAPQRVKKVCWVIGCGFVSWAALRCPNGAAAFLWIIAAGLLSQTAAVITRLFRVAPSSRSTAPGHTAGGAASAAAASLFLGLVWLGSANTASAANEKRNGDQFGLADSVIQELRVQENFVSGTARIRWTAERGQLLPVLFEPATLVRVRYPTDALKLVQGVVVAGGETSAITNLVRAQEFKAKKSGTFEIEIEYGLPVTKCEGENGFQLPTESGLVNRLDLTVHGLDVDVVSSRAVAIERTTSSTNTLAKLKLAAAGDNWIGWKPRSRDLKREHPVFYADFVQLYVPSAGIIEGTHKITIKPAQGELSELVFIVPAGASITDVADPAACILTNGKPQSAFDPLVALWRFDPDTHKLRVTFNRPQSRPFSVLVRSQCAAGPLPLDYSVGLLGMEEAAGQLGLVGIATGNEVQLDDARAPSLAPLNLEDFPNDILSALQANVPGLTVRRAFRYSDRNSIISLKASAVEPDVRVETQTTVSLGEDRTVVAATATVDITRAGIFHLSFVLPAGFDVESISGAALSHWTELNHETNRVVTLHLHSKTEGQQQFVITLAGAGLKATNDWSVPLVMMREASKQRGTVLLVPEQGLRLQVATVEGLTQLDPQKSGIKQKGVLGFRMLQTPCKLSLDIERVDPWIQVTSLQHATLTEALLKVDANLQYQIENTGLKAFRVLLPTNAANVRFQGEQLAEFRSVANSETNGLQTWEIKLQRRVMGQFILQVNYQTALLQGATEIVLRGLQALDVNLQRGFVTIRSAGRLQVRIDSPPATLQPAEWQSIPRALQQGLPEGSANYTYRLVETAFALPVRVERHEPTKLLEARVNSVSFKSVISEDGLMLTQVQLELVPGDKRLLNLSIPTAGEFWFAFVNQGGVWPWREQERILIPLEQQGAKGKPLQVEFFYTCPIAKSSGGMDFELLAPKFDLPLENVTWKVSLNDKWVIKKWAGAFELHQQSLVHPEALASDPQNYLQNEAVRRMDRTRQAEEFLAAANSALAQGEPQQARRAFQAAFGLSSHDAAFNEDARVQLHNIKLQEALVGLNMRQADVSGDSTLGAKVRDLHNRKEISYTQQDAKDIIDRNSAEENAAFMRLAERLVQQQDAVVSTPTALRTSIPEQGRLLVFKRAVVVDPWADLRIELNASSTRASGWVTRASLIAGTLLILLLFSCTARWASAITR
jgi:hypothetical protein